jgi:hypothetical protein
MPNKKIFTAVVTTVLLAMLAGCNLPFNRQAADPGLFYTQAASTIMAEMTYSVVETMVQQKTEEAKATSTPTATATPAATNTPTETPEPTDTPIPPTKTPVPIPCNALEFVADITIDDGETMAPNEDFEKIWRLRNIGTCTWTSDYDLVYVDGDQMDGDKAIPLPNKVSPGNSIDVAVDLTAPSARGTYTGYWMLRSSGGSYFGWGPNGDNAFYVKINVDKSHSSTYDTPFYFADHLCSAEWTTEDSDLPCPGDPDSEDGSAIIIQHPWIEKGGRDNEPAIVVHPEYVKNGEISGKFAPIRVADGDHFVTAIGCMKDEDNCDVVFELKYRGDDNTLQTLGSWNEDYDGKITNVDIDLSSLKDQRVTFYLNVYANGSYKGDTAFWLNPQIR